MRRRVPARDLAKFEGEASTDHFFKFVRTTRICPLDRQTSATPGIQSYVATPHPLSGREACAARALQGCRPPRQYVACEV